MSRTSTENINPVKADIGQRMIWMHVGFTTDGIARPNVNGLIVPKHAWDVGFIKMAAKAAHGLQVKNPVPFNAFYELPWKMADVLVQHGVVLHMNNKSRKLFAMPPEE